MEPVKHPGATRRFGAPADWDQTLDGSCGVLEIADLLEERSGNAVMESMWRPNADEIAVLNRGSAIVLGIFGTVHPVVYVSVSAPPQHDSETRGETACAVHNKLAPEIVSQIVKGTNGRSAAMVVTESVLLGVLLATGNTSTEYLDALTERVAVRLAEIQREGRDGR